MSTFTSNFAPQIEAMLEWRTSLGHVLRDMRNAMAGSSGYFRAAPIVPLSRGLGASTKPGAIHFNPTMVQRVIRTYQLPSRRQRLSTPA